MKQTLLFLIACLCLTCSIQAMEPTAQEMKAANDWVATTLSQTDQFPFSFKFNGVSSDEFLKDWSKKVVVKSIEDGKTLTTITFADPAGQLEVECYLTQYSDFPVILWSFAFRNPSDKDSPILEDIRVIDTELAPVAPREEAPIILHHALGGQPTPDCYTQKTSELTADSLQIKCRDGRPTSANLPYFNVQTGNQGWIFVLGWSGQWTSNFVKTEAGNFAVDAGQEFARFKLLPKESVTQPTVVLVPWIRSNWIDAQNVWRTWFIKHWTPKTNGEVVKTHIAGCSSFIYSEMINATAENQIMCVNRYLEEGIQLDYWWMDAGWYPCDGNWTKTGTWEVDPERFPNGFGEIADAINPKGVKNLVWFEPERLAGGTWLTDNHPEWCSNGKDGGLFNLGDPDAWNWLVNHIDQFLKDNKIDYYRQDFNMDPLAAWKKWDSKVEDRDGITEIRHVEGYLAYWDALLERNPGLRIDSCASGGHRNDLQTMHRSVPLLRSDYWGGQEGQQCQTMGISLWIPLYGSNMSTCDQYDLRSRFFPYLEPTLVVTDKNLDYDTFRKNIGIWEKYFVPMFDKDFYPITSCKLDRDVWVGWQYNDPENGKGLVQLFRRPESTMLAAQIPLFGLDSDAEYEITDVDTNETKIAKGQELMETGLTVTIKEKPGTAIISFVKK